MELPLLVFPVGEGDPLVAGDDAVVDGEDGLGVHPYPGNLHNTVLFSLAMACLPEHSAPPVAMVDLFCERINNLVVSEVLHLALQHRLPPEGHGDVLHNFREERLLRV